MKKTHVSLTVFILFNLIFNNSALSWEPKSSHKDFSRYAAENSVLRECIDETDIECDYLKNLGFVDALNTRFKWGIERSVEKWLAYGSYAEDKAESKSDFTSGEARALNHFHNPIRPWSEAGLNDIGTGESSLLWAQDGSYQQDFHEGDWSWQTVRDKYYWALTDTTETQRQLNFAQTFKGLGHQMHFIQDAAQPEHARNDVHILGRFEAWAKDEYPKLGILKVLIPPENLIYPALPDPSTLALDQEYNSRNLVPSALFIDTDQYRKNGDDYNPLITSNTYCSVTLNTCSKSTDCPAGEKCVSSIGIAEYTNANFASHDTFFKEDEPDTDKHYFPYPRESSTNLPELIDRSSLAVVKYVEAEDSVIEPTLYIEKTADGETITHFAKPKYTTTGWWSIAGGGIPHTLDYYLDEECFMDYTQKLIPRAIGYSAGLLDYFFRGDIEPVSLAVIVNTNNEITSIRMRIRNNTPNESLEPLISPEESKFIISFQYTLPGDSSIYYVLSDEVVLNETIASGGESTGEFIFTITQGQEIPSNAQDVKFYVVYRGKLGNEDDAVIGRYNYIDNLAITAPDEFIYSIIEGGNTPYTDSYGNQHQQFISMQANVNITELNGTIESGNIQAVAKYKMRTDYQPDLTNDPPMAGSRESDYSYSTSSPAGLISGDITALNALEVREFTFDFSGDPIPAGITDLYLEITIIGKVVGDTEDIIIATGTTDLNEPQHFSIWNATDWFYLDGVLRTADEIINTPALLTRVDFDGDGIVSEPGEPYIDPYDVTTEVAFYPTTETPTLYNAEYTPLPPGRFGNIIILTDMPDFYIRIHRQSTIPSVDWTSDILYSGVTNQENNGTFESTQVITFRGIIQHQWAAYVSYYPDAVGISTAPWPVPAITDPYLADALSP